MDEHLQNNNLLSKWLSGELTDEEKQELEKEGSLDELKVVVDDLNTWSLPKFDVDSGLERILEVKVDRARLFCDL